MLHNSLNAETEIAERNPVTEPNMKPALSSNQRRALAAFLATTAVVVLLLWSRSGSVSHLLGGLGFFAAALSVGLYSLQSTAALLSQFRSPQKPPILALVLHLAALALFASALLSTLSDA
jgi:hypothetical protein